MCDGTTVQDPCWKQTTKAEFDYYGSCLGKFQVKDAVVWECSRCGGITLLASVCKGWEVEKAVELIEKNSFFTGIQVRFIREICGKNQKELAVALDVPAEEVKRWEDGIGTPPGESRRLARYFLRQEERYQWISGPCGRPKRILDKIHWESED